MACSGERTIAASTRTSEFAYSRACTAVSTAGSPLTRSDSRPVRGFTAAVTHSAKFVCSCTSNSSSSIPVTPARSAKQVVIYEIEHHIEQGTARIGLHGLQRVPPIAMARAFESGDAFDGVEPGRRCVVEPDRDGVEEQPGGDLGAGAAGAPVGDQPSRDIHIARESL